MLYTSIPILFLIVGILGGVSLIALVILSREYTFKWYTWAMAVSGLSLVLFTIAWSVTSVLEGESQAAGMGLVFFGMPGIVLILLTRKLLAKYPE